VKFELGCIDDIGELLVLLPATTESLSFLE